MNDANANDIKKKIKEFIMTNFLFGNESKTFSDSDSFLENGIIDSTGVLELIEFVESNYTIKLEDNELIPENLDSLNNLSVFILKKMGK